MYSFTRVHKIFKLLFQSQKLLKEIIYSTTKAYSIKYQNHGEEKMRVKKGKEVKN